MIWLSWRQFRVQASAMAVFLVVLAAALALTGPGIADDYSSGLAACGDEQACERFTQSFFDDYKVPFFALILLLLVLPALIGLFWGAPLVARELEAGTHRLVWYQSVTRTRWLTVKLAMVGAATVIAAGLGTLAVEWWADPLDKSAAENFTRLSPLLFDTRGVVAVGYAAFAFALGVTVGMMVRRTLMAMTITMAVFVAVQVAMPILVRPHLLPETTVTTQITRENLSSLMAQESGSPIRIEVDAPDPKAWVLSNETLDRSGQVVETIPLSVSSGPCGHEVEAPPPPAGGGTRPAGPMPPGPPQSCVDAINKLGYKQRIGYHADNRYWPLQWIETGIFGGLALGLAGFSFWWLRRKVS